MSVSSANANSETNHEEQLWRAYADSTLVALMDHTQQGENELWLTFASSVTPQPKSSEKSDNKLSTLRPRIIYITTQ